MNMMIMIIVAQIITIMAVVIMMTHPQILTENFDTVEVLCFLPRGTSCQIPGWDSNIIQFYLKCFLQSKDFPLFPLLHLCIYTW